MPLEKKKEEKTNYHLKRFIFGISLGTLVGLFSEENRPFLVDSLMFGFIGWPMIDKLTGFYGWKQAYENAPAQTVGLYLGLNLGKLITQYS